MPPNADLNDLVAGIVIVLVVNDDNSTETSDTTATTSTTTTDGGDGSTTVAPSAPEVVLGESVVGAHTAIVSDRHMLTRQALPTRGSSVTPQGNQVLRVGPSEVGRCPRALGARFGVWSWNVGQSGRPRMRLEHLHLHRLARCPHNGPSASAAPGPAA